jgi:hypothetical protein
MSNQGKLSEKLTINMEAMTASTVAGTSTNTSGLYDMRGYDRAFLGLCIGLKASSALSSMSSIVVDLVESSASSAVGTSAAGAKVGIQIGSTNNTVISTTDGCIGLMFQEGSAASNTGSTTGDIFRLGLGTDIVTFTFSSLATEIAMGTTNTNIKSTIAYFGSGSALGTTDGGGPGALCDNLRNTLRSTQICFGGPDVFRFSTPSSYQLQIDIVNSTKGCFYFGSAVSTARHMALETQCAVGFDIRAEQLTSTLNKRFVGLKYTTAAQAMGLGITVIRSAGRYMPQPFLGKLSS